MLTVSPDGQNLYSAADFILAAFTVDGCGSAVRTGDEQCDDGNVVDGDGCSASCKLELCGPAPIAGCKGTAPQQATLILKDKALNKSDRLIWKWNTGAQSSLADFGDPTTGASYVLCVYDSSGSPQPLMSLAAPAAGTCAGHACWQPRTRGRLAYADKLLAPDGVSLLELTPGAVDGESKITAKGRGSLLGMPPLPLVPPVTVQLRNTETAVCWDAQFVTPINNEPGLFESRGD